MKIKWFVIPFLSNVLDSVRFSTHWTGCFSFRFLFFVLFVVCLVGGVDVSRATEPTDANHNDQKPKGWESDDKTTSFIPYWRFWFGENLKWKRRNKLMNNKSKLLNNLLIALLIKIFKIPFSIVILFDNIFKMISWLTVRDYLFIRYKMGSLYIEYLNFIVVLCMHFLFICVTKTSLF